LCDSRMLHELASQTPDQLSVLLQAAYNLGGLVDRNSPARRELDDVLARFRRVNGHPEPYGLCCPLCGDVPRPSVGKEIVAGHMDGSTWLVNHCWSRHFECQACVKKINAAEEARKQAAERDGKDVGPAKGQRAPRYGTWIGFLDHHKTQHRGANMWWVSG
jgi:hypothetical protein